MKLEWLTSNNPQQAFLYIMRMKTVNILRLKKKPNVSNIEGNAYAMYNYIDKAIEYTCC